MKRNKIVKFLMIQLVQIVYNICQFKNIASKIYQKIKIRSFVIVLFVLIPISTPLAADILFHSLNVGLIQLSNKWLNKYAKQFNYANMIL